MANRYANLVGSNKIKDEWQKINTGFDLVQADMDEKADAGDLTNLQNTVSDHIGSGGNAHAEATTTEAGFMSAADKQKLDGIEEGAQVNQNAFARVNDVEASDPSDELTITGGTGITVTTNPNTKEVIVTATGEATPGPHGSSHTEHGADPIPAATTTEGGLMSADHVQMLESHASRHAAGGADPLTPEDIGAIPISAATSAATPNTIVMRDANGRFKAAAPSAADDVSRKAEVDALEAKTIKNLTRIEIQDLGETNVLAFTGNIYDDQFIVIRITCPSASNPQTAGNTATILCTTQHRRGLSRYITPINTNIASGTITIVNQWNFDVSLPTEDANYTYRIERAGSSPNFNIRSTFGIIPGKTIVEVAATSFI